MKMKKIILSSLATIALSASLASGATYALFTSSADVNIAISAGKVNVTAAITKVDTYSMDVAQPQGKFENAGTATLDGKNLTLTNITPGDRVVVTIDIANNGNVSTFGRTIIGSTVEHMELFNALDIKTTTGGVETPLSKNLAVTEWSALPASSQLLVDISLPVTAGNELQEKTCSIFVVFEAIQANGVKTDSEGKQIEEGNSFYAVVRTEKELQDAIDDVNKSFIKIMDGTYAIPLTIDRPVVIFGESAEKTIIQPTASAKVLETRTSLIAVENTSLHISNLTINGYTYKPFAAMVTYNANVVVDGVIFDVTNVVNGEQNASGFYAAGTSGFTTTIKNSTFKNFSKGGLVIRATCTLATIVNNSITGLENNGRDVEGNPIKGIGQNGLQIGGKAYIADNTFTNIHNFNPGYGSDKPAVDFVCFGILFADGSKTNTIDKINDLVTLENNVFNTVGIKFGAYDYQGDKYVAFEYGLQTTLLF